VHSSSLLRQAGTTLLLLQTLTRSGLSRFMSKNADHGPTHSVAAILVSIEALPMQVEAVVDLVLQVVRAARVAISQRMLVAVAFSNVVEKAETLRPRDVVKLNLSERPTAVNNCHPSPLVSR
jgi:hypothetical protein